MKNVFKLKTYSFDGESEECAISTKLNIEDFEKLIKKINEEVKLDETLISSLSIFNEIIKRLEKLNHKQVLVYRNTYLLDDNCPLPNSTTWLKKNIEYKNLDDSNE